jgi:hypothetical protein
MPKKFQVFFKYQDVGKQDKYAHKSLSFFYSSADCKSKLQLAPWLAAFGTQMQADAPGWGRLISSSRTYRTSALRVSEKGVISRSDREDACYAK